LSYLSKGLKVLKRNKFRYLTIFLGFFLLVGPFALIPWDVYQITGSDLTPSVHTFCYRMPLFWLSNSDPFLVDVAVATYFFVAITFVALLASPLFCGWICPIGGLSEGLSRIVPLPDKYRIRLSDTRVTIGLRYGFFLGFLVLATLIGYGLVVEQYGGVTARYCPQYLLQSFSYSVFGGGVGIRVWNIGFVITLVSWLGIGGILFFGGRGWCLFMCPLGAVSGLACKAGNTAGTPGIQYDRSKCRDCKKCSTRCPMWAIREDGTVEKLLCIGCRECVTACHFKAYRYGLKTPASKVLKAEAPPCPEEEQ
jgi:polyferredoxin